MTMPPRDEGDNPEYGPPEYPPPPGYPYYGGPPPPPGYPHQQWHQPRPLSRISIAMVFVGCGAWAIINVVVALVAILATSGADFDGSNVVLGFGALTLGVIAFGGGGGLLAVRNRQAKGLGLGLMIGWALTSLLTVGFCTGINPGMYA